jgi:phosphoribosylformylglycinamidine synthase PurS subunit
MGDKLYHARIEVRLKPGYMDPEGETARKALLDLMYRVKRVGTARIYEVDLQASSPEDVKKKVDEMCRRLLANPVKDDYVLEIREMK